jgi:electron transfer flavoprotein alpha subunit
VEVRSGAATPGSLGVLRHAAQVGRADAIIVGNGEAAELTRQAAANGATQVLLASGAAAAPLPRAHADAALAAYQRGSYDAILLGGSVLAADVAGYLSAALEAGVNWELTSIAERDGELTGVRPLFDDSLLADVGWTTAAKIALFRPGALAPAEAGEAAAGSPEVTEFSVPATPAITAVTVASAGAAVSGDRSLARASVIVSGGRGIGTKENLQLIRDLAEALHGEPAVSLPLVSAGWAPYEMQVGQTGTVVRPDLYIACGVSGQVQHRTGMQFAKVIIAINTDPNAPIFSFCDLAVQADLLKVVPELTDLVRDGASSAGPRIAAGKTFDGYVIN